MRGMANYFLHVKIFARGKGSKVTKAAAYRAGERILHERTSTVHDYTDRTDVALAEIVLPAEYAHQVGMEWALDRSALWNACGACGAAMEFPSGPGSIGAHAAGDDGGAASFSGSTFSGPAAASIRSASISMRLIARSRRSKSDRQYSPIRAVTESSVFCDSKSPYFNSLPGHQKTIYFFILMVRAVSISYVQLWQGKQGPRATNSEVSDS
jgi:hypothetical protein